MIGLQEMAMPTVGDEICLFTARPRDWRVDIRLHALGKTIVEAALPCGRLTQLDVQPESAARRVVLQPGSARGRRSRGSQTRTGLKTSGLGDAPVSATVTSSVGYCGQSEPIGRARARTGAWASSVHFS